MKSLKNFAAGEAPSKPLESPSEAPSKPLRRIKSIADYEQFLSGEIASFEKSALFARRRGLGRMDIHCQAVADTFRVARAVLRTALVTERVENGDILTTYVVTRKVPKCLKKTVFLAD